MGKRVTIALAVFALIVVPLSIYTAGYLFLGNRAEVYDYQGTLPVAVYRIYPQRWMKAVYQPAGGVEQWLRGIEVEVSWEREEAE